MHTPINSIPTTSVMTTSSIRLSKQLTSLHGMRATYFKQMREMDFVHILSVRQQQHESDGLGNIFKCMFVNHTRNVCKQNTQIVQ